jgi:hypothetical protein
MSDYCEQASQPARRPDSTAARMRIALGRERPTGDQHMDGQNDLSVRDGSTDLFGHVQGGQQGAFLVAGWARTSLLARIGDEHFVLTVRAAHSGKTVLQIAALEKGRHRTPDDRSPVAVLGLKPLVVDLLETVKMFVHQAPQVRGPRIAVTVQGQRLDTRGRHDRIGTSPVMMYVATLEHMYTSCRSCTVDDDDWRPR